MSRAAWPWRRSLTFPGSATPPPPDVRTASDTRCGVRSVSEPTESAHLGGPRLASLGGWCFSRLRCSCRHVDRSRMTPLYLHPCGKGLAATLGLADRQGDLRDD